MNFQLLILSFLIFFLPFFADASFGRNLKLGDRGTEVLALQKFLNQSQDTRIAQSGPGSPGEETDYFGQLTFSAVKKFQTKYRTEVLYPADIFSATGYVGPLTRAKINTMNSSVASSQEKTQTPAYSFPASVVSVQSVFPNKVREGEKVIVYGEGFSKIGNKVSIYYGSIIKTFENLTSEDGKTIEFIYKPPRLQTLTESQIRALPYDDVLRLEGPIKAAGATLSDVLNPYKNFKSEDDLASFLAGQGVSMDVLYDYFYITVGNDKGVGHSKIALLWGLRELPLGSFASGKEIFLSKAREFLGPLMPTAHAQIPGGGFHTGAIMYCTCGAGHLSFAVSLTGAGTGFLWFPPGMILLSGYGSR